MRHGLPLAIGLLALAACSTATSSGTTVTASPADTTGAITTGSVVTTSTGEVGLLDDAGAGMWWDASSGLWMDSTGVLYTGGRTGRRMGLTADDVAALTDANIVAHLATGDSLEIALSQLGAGRADDAAAREFAQRMVTEHSAHLQMGKQMAAQGGVTPAPAPMDTTDARMATRVMTRLEQAPAGAAWDRQLMGAEVMMHRHMLNELRMVQPRATGATRQLVDQTIPVVEQHLAQATTIWKQLGGGKR